MLIKLIAEEAEGSRAKILASAVLSGIANALVLSTVNVAAQSPALPSVRLFIMFLLACALYALSLRYGVSTLSSIFESALYRIRLRVAEKIRKADLQGLEQIGNTEIYERLSQETTVLSQAAWPIASALQSAMMVVFMAVYILSLSTTAFLLALALYGCGAFIYHLRNLRAQKLMRQTTSMQMDLFDRLSDLLGGFKEVQFRAQRGEELHKDYDSIATSLRSSTVQTNIINEENYIFAYLNLFVLLAIVVFIMPQFVPAKTLVLNNLTSGLVFMFGSIGGVIWALPQYGRANVAAENILNLEQKLEQVAGQSPTLNNDPWHGRFQEIRVDDMQFHYSAIAGQEPFAIGPLSLTVRAGEILFIVGGNGSGKSTLVKVLTALYAPTAGSLYVDDVCVDSNNAQAYREMIAAIFGDFHLFKKLYGLPAVHEKDVRQLLEQMRLASKTTFSGGSVSTLNLSTGQRKRLAMVIALLEDRPLYVFDEWAADQDPEFRQYYYEELLPSLKQRGKTVIAISHDDRYFHCADRVITMEYGQIRSDTFQGKLLSQGLGPSDGAEART